jgi:hypothetical protein
VWLGSAEATEWQRCSATGPLVSSAADRSVAPGDLGLPRLSLRSAGVFDPVPSAPDGADPSPGAPTPRRPSLLTAAGGFLAGDAIALGILGLGSYWARHAGEDEYLGIGVLTISYTAAAALFAPPALGVLGAGRTPPPSGAVRGFVAGGAAHLAGLLAAAALWRNDDRRAAAGVLLAVDVGLAPWLVVRSIDAAAQPRALEAPADFARPIVAQAPAHRTR